MASVSRNPDGLKSVQVVCPDGKRRTIRLGHVTVKDARLFCGHVEQLVASCISGRTPEEATLKWLTTLPAKHIEKLQRWGLTDAKPNETLGRFLDDHFARHKHLGKNTLKIWGHVQRNLIDCFGADRDLRSFTEADAEDWRLFLIRDGLGEATRNRRTGFLKQFINDAIKRGYLDRNPFERLKSNRVANTSRQRFVERSEIEQVLNACTDDEFRAVVALSRFGGLRCPSETLALQWADIDFPAGTMLIRRVKTDERLVPLFPELRIHLEAIHGQGRVIKRYSNSAQNLRTRLLRAIKRAGLEPWPRLFHNLRASRETELLAEYPLHVVVKWIGNSEPVAMRHYLMVRDEDFQRASGVVRNPVQNMAEDDGKCWKDVQCPCCGESIRVDSEGNVRSSSDR